MKTFPKTAALFFLFLTLFAVLFVKIEAGERGAALVTDSQRWAILVGVDSYACFQNLTCAVSDTIKLRDKLIDIGFSRERIECLVTGGEQNSPTKNNIENRIQTISENAGEDDLIILALSGHGLDFSDGKEKTRKAYFVPTDANNASAEKLVNSLVSVDWIYETLERSKAKFKLVLVDACRSDPFKGGERAADSLGVKAAHGFTNPPEGIMLLQSCAAGQVSYEAKELEQGVFSYAFLEGLNGKAADSDKKITLMGLVDYTTNRTESYVQEHFKKSQKPLVSGTTGNFILFDMTGLTQEQRTQASLLFDDARRLRKENRLDDANQQISAALAIWKDNEDYLEEAFVIRQLMSQSASGDDSGTLLPPRILPAVSDKLQYAVEQVRLSRERYEQGLDILQNLRDDYDEESPKIKKCKQELLTEGKLYAGYMRDAYIRYGAEIRQNETKIGNLIHVEGMKPTGKTVRKFQKIIDDLKEAQKEYKEVAVPVQFEDVALVFNNITEEELKRIRESGEVTAAEKEPKPGQKRSLTAEGIEYVFRWCPPGEFEMGSPADEKGRRGDETLHHVKLTKGFWLLESEVTQRMWTSVMGAALKESDYEKGMGDHYPIYLVNWENTRNFCEKLSKMIGEEIRLPTESEWEYACRAGTDTPYSFGSTLSSDNANFGGHLGGISPVKSYEPNAWGLYDMHGNVCEWCADWYGAYSSGTVTDPAGTASGSDRVFRGGGWSIAAGDCRSALRRSLDPVLRVYFLGFREVVKPSL